MKFKYFPIPLQFHPEIEILWFIHGSGTWFVADSVDRIGPGELVMIGQNVPHLWYSAIGYRAFRISNLLIQHWDSVHLGFCWDRSFYH